MSRIILSEFNILIDETSIPGVTFIGRSQVEDSFDTSLEIFQIQIIDERNINEVKVYYASRNFDKKWDDRLNYLI
jgi:hypothetical protein